MENPSHWLHFWATTGYFFIGLYLGDLPLCIKEQISSSRTHAQFDGISNGISSSIHTAPSSDFSQYLLSSPRKITEESKADFFNLPSLTSFCFSAFICSSSSCAVPSSAICGTSFPCIASCNTDFFKHSLSSTFILSNSSWDFEYLSIIGITNPILPTIRSCSAKGGRGNNLFSR